MFSITGLNMSAYNAEQLINSNQIPALLQQALAGNDQFTLQPGTHVVDGYGGYNTVSEPSPYGSYTVTNSGSTVTINGGSTHDTLYNIQQVQFPDGVYNTQTGTFSGSGSVVSGSEGAGGGSGLVALDTTTGQPASGAPKAYTGPVSGLQQQYINLTSDNLNVAASSDNWFIHTGAGADAIQVHGGSNVLDGGTGSNFLTGGSGSDTFFVDDRDASADIWSTVNGFHAGDAATIWGVTPQDFSLNWVDNQGASGYTGLTLHATAQVGRPPPSRWLDTAALI
jgi:serralysin